MTKILTLFLLALCLRQASSLFKMTKVECKDVDKNFQISEICRINVLRRNVYAFNFQAKLLKKVTKCLVNGDLLKKANGYRTFFINQTVDACEFIKNRKKYPMAYVIYNLFSDCTNLNHSCPYEGTVYLKNFILDPRKLLIPLPSGEYLLRLNWIMNEELRFTVSVWFSFEEEINGRRTFEILF